MPSRPEDDPAPGTRSEVHSNSGEVVQAGYVEGGIHFHYGPGGRGHRPLQLPRGVRGFVNRISELAALDELLVDEENLVVYVISGTAGVGKTSLALHWAHRTRDQFPDGQLYIDLRGYDPGLPVSPDQALERFLLALGVPAAAVPAEAEAKSSLYRSALADRRMLIILDNAAGTAQVRPLIPGSGQSLAIITSRSQLQGLAIRHGARRRTLGTLTETEAVALLTATTREYRHGDDPAEVAEMARLCAYLPLALRLAAERAASRPVMPLSKLIASLRDESELWSTLSTGDPDEAEAVHTVFAWSYRALSEQTATVFCLLGLHPGADFSEAAAEALAGGNRRQVRTALDQLAGACLLEATGYERYRFHDLLRAYAVDCAQSKISQEDQLAAVQRVCEWYLRMTYECALMTAHDTTLLFELPRTGEPPFASHGEAARWYAEEKSNLEAAVHAAAGTGQRRTAWRLATVLERIYATHNHFNDWRSTSQAGLECARELGLRAEQAAMHDSLGRLCRMTMRLDEAVTHHAAAVATYRDLGDLPNVVKGLNGLGWVHLFRHRLAEARATLSEALAAAGELADREWLPTVLYSLGYTCAQLGLLDEADAHLTRSVRIFRELGSRLYESMALTAISYAARERGDAATSLEIASEAVAISREMANRLWEATALLYLGKAERAAGEPGAALVSYQASAVLCRQNGDRSREAMAVEGAGLAYRDLGRDEDAADFHRQAAAAHRQLGDHWKLAKNLVHLARELPRGDEARRCAQEAAEILAEFDDPKSTALRASLPR
ncbi:Predicted ATPase [Lentzea fradiae]|uniref:Predicted ATPase n=1 Tax=Lentzea fradiae TaxID=200378 RepID=A0A1G8ADC1_9PSEU|nr:tetratricopeptide repeat protein [Lentzea fradiae]SDH19015.1 Predicted ATPase [Lentzea fradiae]